MDEMASRAESVIPMQVSAPMPGFGEFFEAEKERLLRALTVITGSLPEAEDIAQDAFMKVYERWPSVSVMDEPVGYLHRTAMNVFRNRYRRASLALRRGLQIAPAPDGFTPVDDRDVVARALARLTPRQRAAMILTAQFGYTGEEAGRMLGVSSNTVWALTHQARAALAESGDELDA
jgi:RNA polymerase sigma-70 factor (ECF subfamily)